MKTGFEIDWSTLQAPEDDGAARHLTGLKVPSLGLASTAGGTVDLSTLAGLTVVYIYPMTGRTDRPLPEGWNEIPGARGCTPQSCAFRDHFTELVAAGAGQLFGLSSQPTAWQREATDRLHLPFALLSDADLAFAKALALPLFEADGMTLIKRMTLIVRDSRIVHVFYPVFPPDRNAGEVLDWLASQSA